MNLIEMEVFAEDINIEFPSISKDIFHFHHD